MLEVEKKGKFLILSTKTLDLFVTYEGVLHYPYQCILNLDLISSINISEDEVDIHFSPGTKIAFRRHQWEKIKNLIMGDFENG